MPRLVVSVPTDSLAERLGDLPDGVELLVWPVEGPAPRSHIDIVVTPYMGKRARDVYPHLEGVTTRLVQGQSIGYESVERSLPAGHIFANAAGVHEDSTAELALALVLAAQRQLPDFVRAQSASRDGGPGSGYWAPVFASSLADRRVMLLGYGGVGRAVAARLAPFQVDLTVVAGHARTEAGVTVHGADEFAALLPQTEILIAALPGGAATRHFIGDAELAALPDGALVVNVGRGPLIDTDALIDHAGRGRIRAALDVTDPEPLPDGHPLWHTPGILISPHVGGASTAMPPRIARLVREQISRLLRDDEPLNVVLRS